MFGMGFTEILLIAVIAILFLGPDKLPSTMVEVAKFFRNMKNTVSSVKESIEDEMNMSEIKKEALAYKQELLNASENLGKVTDLPSQASEHINSVAENILEDEPPKEPKTTKQSQEVTFKKKKKTEKKIDKEDSTDV